MKVQYMLQTDLAKHTLRELFLSFTTARYILVGRCFILHLSSQAIASPIDMGLKAAAIAILPSTTKWFVLLNLPVCDSRG